MIKYEHLLGRKFIHGRHDCYDLIRRFYFDNYNIELRNYARPDTWWETDANLYMDSFRDEGFSVFDGPPQQWLPGDLILMAIRSRIANHAGVLVKNGHILHHLWGRSSVVEQYRGLTRNTTTAILRHRDVTVAEPITTIEALDVLPPAFRRKYAQLVAYRGEGEGGTDPQGSNPG